MFNFDSDKAVSAILYIAYGLSNSDMHSVFKTLYFAEREHLVKYGRPIVGDRYVAMPAGPVPSVIYDWCKESRFNDVPFNDAFHLKNNSYEISPLKDPDFDELSQSDIECLDEAIALINPLSFQQRKDISHDEAYDSTVQTGSINMIKMASAGGADEDMIKYIKEKLDFENTLC